MKKITKRKYNGGGITPYLQMDQMPTQLTAPQSVQQYAPGNYNPGSSANFLKSSSFNNAMGKAGGIGDAVTGMIGNVVGTSTATSQSDARKQTAMSSIGGMAKGAQAGAAFGPVGAVVGAAAGLATGLIGKKGKVNLASSAYDDNITMTYGTGIGRRGQNNKLRRIMDRQIANARSNQSSLAVGTENTQDFYEDYDDDVQTMAYGGSVNSLAYVDDGELINTPQGDMLEVPEEGKPTDSNLVSLPEGSKILSDKLKMPGTKETFAQVGKRMMSKKKSKGKDKYAENAAKLNQMNDTMIHNNLFNIQESLKMGKRKKNGIQAAAWGDVIGKVGTDIASLVPVITNMGTKPESFSAQYNPYESSIAGTMANRRFNIDPAKRAIRENRGVSNYNAANYNPNTGANLAYRVQSQIATDKGISDLYSQASNINNQHKADYANTLNNLGQQRVQATNLAVDQNARSRAAANNIRRTGATQISQYFQNKQLMKNQKNADMAMLEAYKPFLEMIYKNKDYSSLIKQFSNR